MGLYDVVTSMGLSIQNHEYRTGKRPDKLFISSGLYKMIRMHLSLSVHSCLGVEDIELYRDADYGEFLGIPFIIYPESNIDYYIGEKGLIAEE